MRRKSFWTLGLVACLALAIASFADHKPGHKKPGGGGGKGGGKVSLIGTFRDTFSPDGDDRIMSDCKGGEFFPCPYIDGEGAVVSIDGHGHFNLNLKASPNRAVRSLFLDFTQCAETDEELCTAPFSAGSVFPETFMRTGVAPGNMAVGTVEPNEKLILLFRAADPWNGNLEYKWKVRFQPDPAPNSADPEACVGSSNITVGHPEEDTWLFVAPGEAGSAVACLESRLFSDARAPFVLRGKFFMPFMITAKRRPK